MLGAAFPIPSQALITWIPNLTGRTCISHDNAVHWRDQGDRPMGEDIDFSALYRMLGVDPACGVAQLRQAYRRAVARLHPDQRGGADDIDKLQELNRLYRAAMGFLRVHGRLPGAPVSGPTLTAEPATPADRADRITAAASRSSSLRATARLRSNPDKAGSERRSRYFIWLAVLAMVALALPFLGPAELRAPSNRYVPQPDVVVLGMSKSRVKRVQGAPSLELGMRWQYGPSWIEFGCGGVVTDWYNSPIHALRTASPRPRHRDRERFDRRRPVGC